MPTTQSSQTLSTVLPEIEKSDLDAVRSFLTADRQDIGQSRQKAFSGPSKGPTISFGITRARTRSVAKASR